MKVTGVKKCNGIGRRIRLSGEESVWTHQWHYFPENVGQASLQRRGFHSREDSYKRRPRPQVSALEAARSSGELLGRRQEPQARGAGREEPGTSRDDCTAPR